MNNARLPIHIATSTDTALPTSEVPAATAEPSAPTAEAAPRRLPSSGGGLSTGAKAGIGAGISVLALVGLAALAFFLLRRRRRRYAQASITGPASEDDTCDGRAELPSENAANRIVYVRGEMSEMDASPREAAEMDGGDATWKKGGPADGVAELGHGVEWREERAELGEGEEVGRTGAVEAASGPKDAR